MPQPLYLFLAVWSTALLTAASCGAVLRLRYRVDGPGRVLPWITLTAVSLNAALLVWRMASVGPNRTLAVTFDFTLLLSTLIALMALLAEHRATMRGFDGFLLPIATLIQICGFLFIARQPAAGVEQAWFVVHPLSLVMGAALLTCGGTAGVVYLVTARILRRKDSSALLGRVAPLEAWERFIRWNLSLGFALFSFGILTGICEMVRSVNPSAWVQNEFIIASFAIWGVYMVTVTAAWLVPSFRGRRVAILAAGSAAALVFVIMVVDMLSPLHR
ncbi:MAG TPA: cytochrome c biogenesis protein CcsA [Phycisphaerae bacterium]